MAEFAICCPTTTFCLTFKLPGIETASTAELPTTLTYNPNTQVKDYCLYMYIKPFCSAEWSPSLPPSLPSLPSLPPDPPEGKRGVPNGRNSISLHNKAVNVMLHRLYNICYITSNSRLYNKGSSCYVAIYLQCDKKLCYIAHSNLPDAL